MPFPARRTTPSAHALTAPAPERHGSVSAPRPATTSRHGDRGRRHHGASTALRFVASGRAALETGGNIDGHWSDAQRSEENGAPLEWERRQQEGCKIRAPLNEADTPNTRRFVRRILIAPRDPGQPRNSHVTKFPGIRLLPTSLPEHTDFRNALTIIGSGKHVIH